MSKRRRWWKSRCEKEKDLSIDEIEALVRIMDANRLTEVTVQENNRKLAVRRDAAQPDLVSPAPRHDDETDGFDPESLAAITSPAVGIFYSSPSPGAAVYVAEGQIVEVGQVVAVIETLKVMNEVRSPISGKVVAVEAHDGDAVEFGQTLMLCEVAH